MLRKPTVTRRTGLVHLRAATLTAGALAACGATGGGSAPRAKTTVTPIRIWFHWSAAAPQPPSQALIDRYNSTQDVPPAGDGTTG